MSRALSTVDSVSTAFRAVVESHGSHVARTLRYLGVPAADLDDAVQEVFMVAHRRWHELADRDDLGAWLRRVALNVARNARRARLRSPLVPMALPPELEDLRSPDTDTNARQLRQRLLALLEHLPEDERAALVLFEIEGLSMKDVADALDASLATAYRKVQSARETLRRALDAHGEAP